jgi:hypothetical protein
MQFFEISKQAEEAARLGRWMMDQTYNIKEDHQFANTISRLGDALTKFDMPHGTSWKSFNKQEKALIIKCKKIMEKKT